MSGPTPGPPPPDWDLFTGTPTEFNNAQTNASKYGYDATSMAIKDSSGVANYLYVGVSQTTSGHVAWYLRTVAGVGSAAPLCKIPQLTFDAIKNGTLNTSNGQISYNSHVYLLKIEIDSNGIQIAFAFQVQ